MPVTLPPPAVSDSQWEAIVAALTRRQFVGTSLAAGLSLGVAACGGDDGTTREAADGTTAWSFVDDRQRRVDLPRRPQRVVCLTDTVSAALWSAGLRPLGAADSGQGINQAARVDFSQVHRLSVTDGGVDVEALAALRPDLLVDAVQADGRLQATTATPKAARLAPVVGLDVYRPVERIIATADRLSTALGAPLADRAAQGRYRAAAERLRAATRRNPDLRVAFVFGLGSASIGVMNPATWAVLKTVAGLGVHLVPVPAGKDNEYSQEVSFERVAEIPADLLVWAVADPMPRSAIWRAVPAVRSGQVWKPSLPSWYAYSYDNFGALLDGLADRVASARPGVGPS